MINFKYTILHFFTFVYFICYKDYALKAQGCISNVPKPFQGQGHLSVKVLDNFGICPKKKCPVQHPSVLNEVMMEHFQLRCLPCLLNQRQLHRKSKCFTHHWEHHPQENIEGSDASGWLLRWGFRRRGQSFPIQSAQVWRSDDNPYVSYCPKDKKYSYKRPVTIAMEITFCWDSWEIKEI